MEGSLNSSRPTLARRVSDLFKEGNTNGSHLHFTQKLRHCCQNPNQFPYLLYSMGDRKTTTQKLTINQFIFNLKDRLFQLYSSLRLLVHSRGQSKAAGTPPTGAESAPQAAEPEPNMASHRFAIGVEKLKPQTSKLLIMGIYLAPLILIGQLIGIFSLLILGDCTPGFVFLLSALFFLGYISVKVFFNDSHNKRPRKTRGKRKNE